MRKPSQTLRQNQGNAGSPDYSIVVPVFQSTDGVGPLVQRLEAVFTDKIKASYEIILVDDGSGQAEVWAYLAHLAEARSKVKAIRLTRNFGKPGAILCGFAHAKGNWIITIDDDLQQLPEDIEKLIAYRDHDVVVATYKRKKHSWRVALISRLKASFDFHILGVPIQMTPLKMIGRHIVERILQRQAGRPYIPALLAHVTSDFIGVPLDHQSSSVAKSRYNLLRKMRQFSNLTISYSGIFMRVWGLLGFCLLAIGILFLLAQATFHMGLGLQGTLLGALMAIGGAILLALGIVGEYLIRLIELTSNKPPYIVRDMVGIKKPSNQSLGDGQI